MNKPLRKLLGVMGIGLSWSVVWGAFFAMLALMIGIFRPPGATTAAEIDLSSSRKSSASGLCIKWMTALYEWSFLDEQIHRITRKRKIFLT